MPPDVHADTSELGLALYATQAGANVLLALVLIALHRAYRRPFLLHWGLSWLALACFYAGSALAARLVHLSDVHPVRSLVAALTLSAGFAHIAGLISGTWLLASGRELGRSLRPWLLAIPFVLGGASVIATLELGPAQRLFARVGVLALLSGLALLVAALAVARAARRERALSRALVAVLLCLAGLTELFGFLARFAHLGGDSLDPLAAVVAPNFFGLFLQLLLVSSLLLWFFEDERANLARTARALSESEDQRRRSEHMEAVGRLAGGVAHDFNNLLTAITGHAELLLSRAPEGHPDREDLLPISRASTRAAELVRELLTFSRRQPLRPRRFVLDRLLAGMQKMLERLVGEGVRFELDLGAPAAVLHADPAQIELAVINLASNARDALAGHGDLVLRTSVSEIDTGDDVLLAAGRYVRLDVVDSGCGIRADALGKIFEPFYTTKPGKGTGLGLASVYGIVKQSGGDIRVESAPGLGATFRIWLPFAEEDALYESDVELIPAHARGGSETILLVEDDAPVRELAQRQLSRAGYRVVVAENADQALERLRPGTQGFQLLLSDVVMPGRSLRDFQEELRLYYPELRILWMSGYSEAAVGQRGIALASAHFLSKPFTSRALLDAVRDALDAPRSRQVPSESAS